MSKKNILSVVVCWCLFLVVHATAFGQGSLGGITGTVVDTNGAVVPGASVEVTSNSTGEKRTVTASGDGVYTVTDLQVGTYTVKASAANFASTTIKEVKVSVAFNTSVRLTLNASGTSETIQVSGSDVETQVNTTDHQLSTLLNNTAIIDLPLLSRDPSNLVLLAPGTVRTNGIGGFSVNGSRERNNNFRVDGVDNNDAEVPGIPGGLATPNIDATQEFRVITGNGNAEFGRNTGGIITVATKSGSNAFHGNSYIYYRSSAFAARDFFAPTGSIDPLQRKQFGGSLGGPIKKDKLFFFVNYEGDRFLQGFQDLRTVPTASARAGILKNVTVGFDTAGNPIKQDLNISAAGFNNSFGLPFDPATSPLLNLFPLPNDSDPRDVVSPGNLEAFRFSNANLSNQNSLATRIDYNISSRNVLSGSYNLQKGTFNSLVGTFPTTNDGITSPQRGQLVSISLISTISPRFVNEGRFGYNRANAAFNGAGDGGVSTNLRDAVLSSFAKAGYGAPANFGGTNGTQINLTGMGISSLSGFDTQNRITGTTTISDSLSYIRGNHSFKFGGELRLIHSESETNFGRSETLSFSVPTTFNFPIINDNSGKSISPFLTGEMSALQNYASFLYGFTALQTQSQYFDKSGTRVNNNFRRFREKELDLFFQDTFRVRTNLSLNYGLRWEYKGVPYEADGLLSNLIGQDPSRVEPAGGFIFQLVGKNSGTDNLLYKNDYNNFAPRFGFSYSPDFKEGFLSKLTGGPGKMSIRGGYGIYYDRVFGNVFTNARGNPPFEQDLTNFVGDLLGTFSRPTSLTSSTRVPSGAEIAPVLFPQSGNNPFTDSFRTPYEQKWSFGFQRELKHDFLAEADYVGAKGTNELRVVDAQLTSISRTNALLGQHNPISTSAGVNAQNGRPNDAFFQPALNLANGFSTYQSLQLKLTKRLTSGHLGSGQFQFAYTLAHAIDDSADSLVPEVGERAFPRDSAGVAGGLQSERGNSGFIPRHNFSGSFTYNIPLKFQRASLDRAFGNWELSSVFFVRSGLPFSIFGNRDSAGTGLSQRADLGNGTNNLKVPTNPAPDPHTQTGPPVSLFANPCPADDTFTAAGGCTGPSLVPRQGNVGRNSFFGPGFREVDFSIIKRIPLTETVKLRLQADFFNLFNNVNFAQPVNTINSNNFGQSVSTIGTPRVIQFAARIDF